MTLQHICEFNDLVEHLVDLLIIFIEFFHELNLILVHVSIGFFVIDFLVFFGHLKHFLSRFEYHLIFNVGVGKYFDTELALLEGVLIIE